MNDVSIQRSVAAASEGAVVDDDGWPTTMCFSRRLGEAVRDADYANALEVPAPASHRGTLAAGLAAGLLALLAIGTAERDGTLTAAAGSDHSRAGNSAFAAETLIATTAAPTLTDNAARR